MPGEPHDLDVVGLDDELTAAGEGAANTVVIIRASGPSCHEFESRLASFSEKNYDVSE